MEILTVVDSNNSVIGQATEDEVYEKKLSHRVVHVLIFNDRGEMALQMRSAKKSFCPLHWSTAVGGRVQVGEHYDDAAVRECKEELFLDSKPEFLYQDLYEDGTPIKRFLAVYKILFNGPFTVNKEEVDRVEFFSLPAIKNMIRHGEKFHPELVHILKGRFDI